METKPTVRPTPQLVLALLIIAAGILFTLDNLGVFYAWDILRLWPALLILFGLIRLSQPGSAPSRMVGVIIAGLGTLLMLAYLGLIHFSIWSLWPLVLVLVGIGMIWQVVHGGERTTRDRTSSVSAVAIMGGVERNCGSEDFRGGELTAFMGGCELDLRDASMQVDEAVLRTFAFWGGIEVKVPEDWTVVVEAVPFLGGVEERTHPPKEGPRKILRVKGLVIMGGIEIRN